MSDDPSVFKDRRRGLRNLWPGADRRHDAAAAPPPESLFGSLVGGDSQIHDDDAAHRVAASARGASDHRSTARHRGPAGSEALPGGPTTTSPASPSASTSAAPKQASEPRASAGHEAAAAIEDNTSQRLYRLFVLARASLGVALVGALVVSAWFGMRSPLPMMLVALAYAAQALVLWILPRFHGGQAATSARAARLSRGQWLATIGIDLVTFSALHWMQPTQNLNFVALLLMPVLMGGVLASRSVALAGSSAVVLMLLASTSNAVMGGGEPGTLWLQTGLAGMGFFAVTLLAGEMSSRLASEEFAARSGLELARQQAQLNRLVIEEMTDGVLVVDRRQRVRAANPAARRLLARQGLGRAAPFQLEDDAGWGELATITRQAFVRKTWPTGENNVTLKFDDGTTRTLRLRARFTRRRSAPVAEVGLLPSTAEVYCVVFMEDLRTVHDRHRQEKLAAMGRVSAGIAHEIRNPLAAIAQANALLSEEVQGREQQMLTRMVSENVERLKLIVDDVMAVAPSRDIDQQTIDAVDVVGRIVAEWARAAHLAIGADTRLRVLVNEGSLPVVFDPEHLRRVLVNLLDNARRYTTDQPGAITLQLQRASHDNAVLSVASDGEPIAADVEPYLFEPFFSTRSRGTGLGLYICRELCERYGATIDYWQHPPGSRHRNEFRVVFRSTDPTGDFPESRLLP